MIAQKITLIHATALAVAPIEDAFERLWPESQRTNLLDDGLSAALEAAGGVDAALRERFVRLALHAQASGADAILFTCSAFGAAVEAAGAAVRIPTFKPNQAMFEEALEICAASGGSARIGMVSTFAASVASMREELTTMARARGIPFTLDVQCPAGALAALRSGKAAEHDALVSDAAKAFARHDVLMLGQFSMSHLRARIAAETGLSVLSSPDSAARLLKRALEPTP